MRALLTLLLAAPALAGGFAVSEQDASASGRAGTGISLTGTASSVHFNPAGLGFLVGPAAQAGATAIVPSVTAVDQHANDTKAISGVAVPPHVYAAWGFDNFALGAGFNTPFGGGVKWPDDWYGRFELVEMSLRVLTGHLAGAWRAHQTLSIGASLQVSHVSVALRRRIDFVDSEGTAQLGGSGVAIGAQVGVDWTPSPALHFALVGRIPATAQLSGRAHFESIPSSFNGTLPDQAIYSSMTLPGMIGAGAHFDLRAVRLFADAQLTFWQSFERFQIDFEDPNTPDVDQPRHWSMAPTFRLGAERDFGKLTVRAGLLADLSVGPSDTLSPSAPDSTRFGGSLGVGYSLGSVRGDLAYQFVAFVSRASSGEALPAGYMANAHLLALTLGYSQN